MAALAKPAWLADHLPGLDGLRGLAIALVLLHHCEPRLVRLGLGGVAEWGWTGVDLFFVLSGFLITGIVLDGREAPHFFRNFYARRGLRILPVFALVLAVNITVFGRANTWSRPGPYWFYFLFFVHNLTPGLTGTIYPSWSLAIEEQFYAVWAPVARRLPAPAMAWLLAAVLAIEPWVRRHPAWFVTTNTLYHLDGLAVGALIALGLRWRHLSQRRWAVAGAAAVPAGLAGIVAAVRWQGAMIDGFVALAAGGLLLWAATGRRRPLEAAWLRYLGKISYSLYLTHMLVFAIIGSLDTHMDAIHAGAWGDAVIVVTRLVLAVAVAAALWRWYEGPILRLKRHFPQRAERAAAPVAAAG